jgi:hypothetical protein
VIFGGDDTRPDTILVGKPAREHDGRRGSYRVCCNVPAHDLAVETRRFYRAQSFVFAVDPRKLKYDYLRHLVFFT